MKALFVTAGTPERIWERHAGHEVSKARTARLVLAELAAMGQSGAEVQTRIAEELCRMDRPHPEAPDQDQGKAALEGLRGEHEQIDGSFHYRGFTYLVEAKWRSTPPDFGDLVKFKGNVDGKLDSTRGLFISMAGFDSNVLAWGVQSSMCAAPRRFNASMPSRMACSFAAE